jgi:hypothetical protein
MIARLLFALALLGLSGWTAAQAAGKNPLIRAELTPLKNANFEQGLTYWVRTAERRLELPERGIVYEAEPVAAEGKQSFSITLQSEGEHYLPSPTFTVPRDHQYYLSAKIKTVGEAFGSVRPVAGAGGEQFSDWIGPDRDWTTVGLAFTATSKANVGLPQGETQYDGTKSYIQLRLQVRGHGKVYFDDIRVEELHPYAPCFRVKLLSPTDRPYRMKIHAMVGSPNWYFSRSYFEQGQQPGEYSPWIDLSRTKEFQGDRFNSAGLQFEPLAGPAFEKVKVEIQFASTPLLEAPAAPGPQSAAEDLLDLDSDPLASKKKDAKSAPAEGELYNKLKKEAAPTVAMFRETKVFETPGHIIGVFIPSATVSPDDFAKGLRPLAEDIQTRNAHVRGLKLPPVHLDHFYVEAHHKGFNAFFTDPALLATEVDTIRQIGFSALDTQYAGLAGEYLALAEKVGIAQTHQTTVGHTLVEDPAKRAATFDEAELRAVVARKVAAWIDRIEQQDSAQLDKIRFFVLCDEIWGVSLAGPAFERGYRDYLQRQGIAPKELGKQDYNEISFDKTWSWRETWNLRPQDRTDVAACKDFYWRLRYWSYATAHVYALITEELHRHLPNVPTVINHGAPWAYGYDGYMRGVEVFEFARQNAVSAFLHEDWLNTSGWRHSGIQLCGYLADFSRSIGRVNGSPAFAYVMPAGEEQIQLKLAATIGKGVKTIDLYRYGPAYGSPDNWSQNLPQVAGVARYLRQLDAAEDTLATAQPRPAQTALVWSASNEAWRETDATIYDRQLIYLALQHRQIPTDFVDEFAIEKEGLKNYRVAYLNARYVRRATQDALVEWVEAGGNLWVDALAGTGDEYGQPSEIITRACGVSEIRNVLSDVTQYETQHGLPQQKPLDFITYLGSTDKIEAVGRQVKFTLADAAKTKVLATYDDGSPAVIERKLGKGTIYFVGTAAGCSYSRPVVRDRGKIERGYREAERRAIADFALASGVVRPSSCNTPGVQADLLEGESGTGIVLANFTGAPVEKIVLTVQLDKPATKARSINRGPLEMKLDAAGKTATLEMPLSLTDFVLFE